MNQDQIMGIIRTVIAAGVSFAAGRGLISDGAAGDVTAALVALAVAVWSVVSKKR